MLAEVRNSNVCWCCFFVILNLKEQSPRDQKTVLHQTSQLGESGFDSLLVRVLNNGVASCHLKPEMTEPSRSKKHVVSTAAIGAERFDSAVVCWQKFETATSAGVAFCHPKPEGKKTLEIKKHVLYRLLQLGHSVFDSFVVCSLSFERIERGRAGLYLNHPQPLTLRLQAGQFLA